MKKLVSKYDCFGNEYGIFYSDGTCYLFDCFDFVHDGDPIAQGSFEEMHNKIDKIIEDAEAERF